MRTARGAALVIMLSNCWMALAISWYSESLKGCALPLSTLSVALRSVAATLIIFLSGRSLLRKVFRSSHGTGFHTAWMSLALANVCFLFALLLEKPGRVLFLATLYPVLTLVVEWREKRPGRSEFIRSSALLAIAVFGLALILVDDFRVAISLGDALAIASAVLFALYMLSAKKLSDEERDAAAGAGFGGDVLFALVILAILSFSTEAALAEQVRTLPALTWTSIVTFGLVSGVEFLIINRAFVTLRASEVSMLHLAQPVFVAAIEIFFAEASKPAVYIGGVLVLIAAGLKGYLADAKS